MGFCENFLTPRMGKKRIVNWNACNKITNNQSEKPQQHEPPLAGAFFQASSAEERYLPS